MSNEKQPNLENLPPIKDSKGNVLKVGDKVKILISEFNYPAGIESTITKGKDYSGNPVWIAQRVGVGSYLTPERAKNYEKID